MRYPAKTVSRTATEQRPAEGCSISGQQGSPQLGPQNKLPVHWGHPQPQLCRPSRSRGTLISSRNGPLIHVVSLHPVLLAILFWAMFSAARIPHSALTACFLHTQVATQHTALLNDETGRTQMWPWDGSSPCRPQRSPERPWGRGRAPMPQAEKSLHSRVRNFFFSLLKIHTFNVCLF